MQENNLSMRKIIAAVVGIIIVIIAITQLIHYLSTGTIVITTNSRNATITLKQVSSSGDNDDNKASWSFKTYTGHGTLTQKVPLGQYAASVQGNSVGEMQLIKLTHHTTLRYTINPINTTGVEPVAFQGPQNLAAGADRLVYLDSGTGNLYQVDKQNGLTTFAQDHVFKTVQWANSEFGVGQDYSGRLYVINGTSVTLLKAPVSYSNNTMINYSVASNKKIYISSGANVYVGSASGNFKKIYTANTTRFSLAGGPTQVILNEPLNAEDKAKTIDIQASGKAKTVNYTLGQAAWSPNGRYLANADEGGGAIYDTVKGGSTAIPNIGSGVFINGLSWLDNQTLFYGTGSQVWVYNINTRQARLLANAPLNEAVTYISASDDGAYAYILTGASSGNTAIRRIGLKGQQTPDFIFQLQDILPEQTDSYSAGLINFGSSRPSIAIVINPENQPTNPTQTVAQDLQARGFDTSKLNFEVMVPKPSRGI